MGWFESTAQFCSMSFVGDKVLSQGQKVELWPPWAQQLALIQRCLWSGFMTARGHCSQHQLYKVPNWFAETIHDLNNKHRVVYEFINMLLGWKFQLFLISPHILLMTRWRADNFVCCVFCPLPDLGESSVLKCQLWSLSKPVLAVQHLSGINM